MDEALPATVEGNDVEALIQSMMPFGADDNKVRFIGYRASGFSIREALKLTGIHEKTLRRWRDGDPDFVKKESMIPELRRQLGTEYAHLEFLRNYRLILQKDFDIIVKSMRQPDKMTQPDTSYLLKARGHYTPQQLETLKNMVSGTKSNKQFNFTDFVISMSRQSTKESLTISGKVDDSEEAEWREVDEA